MAKTGRPQLADIAGVGGNEYPRWSKIGVEAATRHWHGVMALIYCVLRPLFGLWISYSAVSECMHFAPFFSRFTPIPSR